MAPAAIDNSIDEINNPLSSALRWRSMVAPQQSYINPSDVFIHPYQPLLSGAFGSFFFRPALLPWGSLITNSLSAR